jgi:uncharacterized RDD family membrane protein YckC
MNEGGVSPLPREARPYQGQRAGLVTRLVAAAIDGIVLLAGLLGVYAGFAAILFMVDPRGFEFPNVGLFVTGLAAFAGAVVYLTVFWWVSGRTYGCLVMGLRVVGRRGQRLRLPGALLRALFCAAFPIGLLVVALSRENRSVQDMVLQTSVIYDWQPRSPTA